MTPRKETLCPSAGVAFSDSPPYPGPLATTTRSQELCPGDQLAGYEIETVLGRGGMGVVYRAFDARLGRPVALKLISPERAQDERFRERFLEESQLAASLDHSNVVPVYDAGEADGHLYIAMRYVEGTDLRTLLARAGPLDPQRAITLIGQVAAALDAAHARGLVHRDVKPANVLVTQETGREHCYLSDFGLTRGPDVAGAPGEPTHLSGTVAYTSPEQITGEPVTGLADVYSLACVLYECLAGKPPFAGRRSMAVLVAHVQETPPPLPSHPALEAVLSRALAKEPSQRHATCGALVEEALAALGEHELPPELEFRSPLVGREEDLRWLRALWSEDLALTAVTVAAVALPAAAASPSRTPDQRLVSALERARSAAQATLQGGGRLPDVVARFRSARAVAPRAIGALESPAMRSALHRGPVLAKEARQAIVGHRDALARTKLRQLIALTSAALDDFGVPLERDFGSFVVARTYPWIPELHDYSGLSATVEEPVTEVVIGAADRTTANAGESGARVSPSRLPITKVSLAVFSDMIGRFTSGWCELESGLITCRMRPAMPSSLVFSIAFGPKLPKGTELLVKFRSATGERSYATFATR